MELPLINKFVLVLMSTVDMELPLINKFVLVLMLK